MKKIRIFALLVSAAMLLSLVYLPSSAAWDGTSVAASFGGGDGSEASPYIISTPAELAKLAKDVNDGNSYAGTYFKMTADIDLGDKNWTPAGKSKAPFSGVFDGDGHTVSGLTSTSTTLTYAGLFGLVTDGSIMHLNVSAEELVSMKYSAAVAANLTVTAGGDNVTLIYDCHVLKADRITGAQVGGIVGRASQTGAGVEQIQITGCSVSNAVITAPADGDSALTGSNFTNNFYGGIIGAAGSTTISGCFTENCSFSAGNDQSATYAVAGGIIGVQGASSAPCYVYNCYCINCKFGISASSDAPVGKADLGGIIGRASHTAGCAIKNCFAAGNSYADTNACTLAGDIIGYCNDWVKFGNCYTSGTANAIGADIIEADYPISTLTAAELSGADLVAKLNAGNSKAVWTADSVNGHPVLNIELLSENECTTADYEIPTVTTSEVATDTPAEVTTDPTTTEGQSETSEVTADVTTAVTDAATEAAVTTDGAVATTEAEKSSGCGSAVSACVLVLALLGTAWVSKKR